MKHGSTGYKNGCRCEVCTEAQRVRTLNYRRRKRHEQDMAWDPPRDPEFWAQVDATTRERLSVR